MRAFTPLGGQHRRARRRFHSQAEAWRVVATTLCAAARWLLPPHGERSSSDRDPVVSPLQRQTGSRGPEPLGSDPKAAPHWLDSSHGVHRIAPTPTWPSLRPLPSRPSPGLRLGAATLRARSVPAVPPGFNGFLRRGPTRRLDPRRRAGLLHPAASHGVRHVSDSWSALRHATTRRSFAKSSPVASTLRSFLLSDSLTGSSPLSPPRGGFHVHRPACPPAVDHFARRRVATPSCTRSDLRAFFRRRVRCDHEVLPPRVARCSHGLWIGTFRCLPRA